jgi:predicted amidohydrolase
LGSSTLDDKLSFGKMTKHPIRIATAQSRVSASVKENGKEIRQLIKAAKEQNAVLIHFTEGALSGYTLAT